MKNSRDCLTGVGATTIVYRVTEPANGAVRKSGGIAGLRSSTRQQGEGPCHNSHHCRRRHRRHRGWGTFPIGRIRKLHHLDDSLFARLERSMWTCSHGGVGFCLVSACKLASMAGEADAERVRLTTGPHAGRIGRVVSERRTTLLVHLEGGAEGEKRERERRACVRGCVCVSVRTYRNRPDNMQRPTP